MTDFGKIHDYIQSKSKISKETYKRKKYGEKGDCF
jgi:hypothetical protein